MKVEHVENKGKQKKIMCFLRMGWGEVRVQLSLEWGKDILYDSPLPGGASNLLTRDHGGKKMGILARSLLGNLTIWREILIFEIKKYIRNSGKSDYLAGKNTLFQAVPMIGVYL